MGNASPDAPFSLDDAIEHLALSIDSIQSIRLFIRDLSSILSRADYDDAIISFADERDHSAYRTTVAQAELHADFVHAYLPRVRHWSSGESAEVIDHCLMWVTSTSRFDSCNADWLGHLAIQLDALLTRLRFESLNGGRSQQRQPQADGYYDDSVPQRVVIGGVEYHVSPIPSVGRFLKIMIGHQSRLCSDLLSPQTLKALTHNRGRRSGPGRGADRRRDWLSQLTSRANREFKQRGIPFEFRKRQQPDRIEIVPRPLDAGSRRR